MRRGGIACDCSLAKGKSVTLDFKGLEHQNLLQCLAHGPEWALEGPWTPEGSFRQLLAVPGSLARGPVVGQGPLRLP